MPLVRIDVPTRARCELVEITDLVRSAVERVGVREGAVVVYSLHTTAGITVQENADPDVRRDLLLALENAVPDAPARGSYRHGEGNSPAHVKTSLIGASQLVPIEGGTLALGTWQGLYLCEFDGPRTRHVLLRMLAEP
jgi:secondary thiamine-phosphate synthase enzyme